MSLPNFERLKRPIADIRKRKHTDHMNESRSFLSAALRRLIDGQEVSDQELGSAVPDPRALGLLEKGAWVQLKNWPEDTGFRANNPNFAAYSQQRLKDLLVKLNR